jgi:phage baseplate assembly protein W
MVDITRIDKITRTEKASEKKPFYSDFYTNFNVHPQNKRLAKYTNEESVKRSIRNLILTEKYDRMFQPEIGCRIKSLLFENMSDIISMEIKKSIQETVDTYEPRARIIDIIVQANESRHAYDIYIYFEVINSVNPILLNLTLYRAR